MKIRKYEIYDITGKIIIGYAGYNDDDVIIRMIMSKSPFFLNVDENINNDEIIMIIPNNVITIKVKEI